MTTTDQPTEWIRCQKCKERIILDRPRAVMEHYEQCGGLPKQDVMDLVNVLRGKKSNAD